MHAIVAEALGGPEVLRYQQLPDPRPGPGQILVRNQLTGVNFADTQARRGQYHLGKTPPYVPGLDCVGIVEELGPDVDGFAVGERIAAFAANGSYATRVVANTSLAYHLPDGVDDEAVGGLTVLITAYNLLTLAGRLEAGETVLVHAAAGSVGHTAIQFARALGARRIIGTVGSASKGEVARAAGADEVILYRDEDFAARVLELTNGRGADLILDSVAGENLVRGLTCLAPFGRLVVFGQASGEAGNVSSAVLHKENRSVIGYSSGSYRRSRPERLKPAAQAAFRHVLAGDVRLLIGARFPLSDAAAAHALVESRESVGKVLLLPGA